MGWGVADQGLSSATNFVLALVVARSATTESFGAFGLVFAIYTVFLGGARALTTEPLALAYDSLTAGERAGARRAVAGAALAMGLAGAAVCAGIGALAGGSFGRGLVALAFGLPGLLVQDAWRVSFFVEGRGRSAFWNDALWGGLLAVFLWVVREEEVHVLVAAWGAAGTLAAVAGSLQAAAVPRLGGFAEWWGRHGSVARHLVADFVAVTAVAHVWLFGAASVAGFDAAGALRGGQVLLGPLNVLFMGAALVVVPEAVGWLRESRRSLLRGCLAVSGALAVASCGWGTAALLLPDSAGTALLGDSWEGARAVLLPLTVWTAATGVVAGLALGVRAAGNTARAAWIRAVSGAAAVAGAMVGAGAAGARGAAWALAGVTAAGILPWWRALRKSVDSPRPAAADPRFTDTGVV